MNKDEVVNYMISEIETIERERINSRPNIDPSKKKKEVIEQILKTLKGVQIDDENTPD